MSFNRQVASNPSKNFEIEVNSQYFQLIHRYDQADNKLFATEGYFIQAENSHKGKAYKIKLQNLEVPKNSQYDLSAFKKEEFAQSIKANNRENNFFLFIDFECKENTTLILPKYFKCFVVDQPTNVKISGEYILWKTNKKRLRSPSLKIDLPDPPPKKLKFSVQQNEVVQKKASYFDEMVAKFLIDRANKYHNLEERQAVEFDNDNRRRYKAMQILSNALEERRKAVKFELRQKLDSSFIKQTLVILFDELNLNITANTVVRLLIILYQFVLIDRSDLIENINSFHIAKLIDLFLKKIPRTIPHNLFLYLNKLSEIRPDFLNELECYIAPLVSLSVNEPVDINTAISVFFGMSEFIKNGKAAMLTHVTFSHIELFITEFGKNADQLTIKNITMIFLALRIFAQYKIELLKSLTAATLGSLLSSYIDKMDFPIEGFNILLNAVYEIASKGRVDIIAELPDNQKDKLITSILNLNKNISSIIELLIGLIGRYKLNSKILTAQHIKKLFNYICQDSGCKLKRIEEILISLSQFPKNGNIKLLYEITHEEIKNLLEKLAIKKYTSSLTYIPIAESLIKLNKYNKELISTCQIPLNKLLDSTLNQISSLSEVDLNLELEPNSVHLLLSFLIKCKERKGCQNFIANFTVDKLSILVQKCNETSSIRTQTLGLHALVIFQHLWKNTHNNQIQEISTTLIKRVTEQLLKFEHNKDNKIGSLSKFMFSYWKDVVFLIESENYPLDLLIIQHFQHWINHFQDKKLCTAQFKILKDILNLMKKTDIEINYSRKLFDSIKEKSLKYHQPSKALAIPLLLPKKDLSKRKIADFDIVERIKQSPNYFSTESAGLQLLQRANPFVADQYGLTILHYAITQKFPSLVEAILKKAANENYNIFYILYDRLESTPQHADFDYCIVQDNFTMLKLLLDQTLNHPVFFEGELLQDIRDGLHFREETFSILSLKKLQELKKFLTGKYPNIVTDAPEMARRLQNAINNKEKNALTQNSIFAKEAAAVAIDQKTIDAKTLNPGR